MKLSKKLNEKEFTQLFKICKKHSELRRLLITDNLEFLGRGSQSFVLGCDNLVYKIGDVKKEYDNIRKFMRYHGPTKRVKKCRD